MTNPNPAPRPSPNIAASAEPDASSAGFRPLVPPGTSTGGTEIVTCADFDRYGTRLVTGGADHRLRMYERVDERWDLVDVWRGHNGVILDVKFSPVPSSTVPLFVSIGEDLRLKIWVSDPTAPSTSGRRFYTAYSQSAGHAPVAYVSVALTAPTTPSPDLLLAAVTRDGLLSILEPVPEPEQRASKGVDGQSNGNTGRRRGQDWKELDQIYPADGLVPRGEETCFRLAFQPFPRAASYVDSNTINTNPAPLAVASLTEVRIYSILTQSPQPAPASTASPWAAPSTEPTGSYKFGSALAVISAGNGCLVRDVAWSPAAHRVSAYIAAAAADGMVRVYDLMTPRSSRKNDHNSSNAAHEAHANRTEIERDNATSHQGAGNGPSFGERVLTVPPQTSTLTASLTRANQLQQASVHPNTAAPFQGATTSTYTTANDHPDAPTGDANAANLSGAPSPVGSGPLVPRLDAKLVAELPHYGVWRVAWIRTGAMVTSIGDSGQGRVWGPGLGGEWVEFAEFGADSETE